MHSFNYLFISYIDEIENEIESYIERTNEIEASRRLEEEFRPEYLNVAK
jgi:hypothetical protein